MKPNIDINTSLYPGISDRELLALNKPAQYLGGELNSVTKDQTSCALRLALCFPDLYSLGMSNLGINLLYEVANSIPQVWAERVFMPEPDMLALLSSKGVPLCSLESKTPLQLFDIIGFTLQYELCITNVFAILEAANIDILAKNRDRSSPLVIAGGPVCFNPTPFASFFDAFFIGDGEDGIKDILFSCLRTNSSRHQKLTELTKIPGVYVPGISNSRILKRTQVSLDTTPSLKNPIVPNIRTIHNRLSIEIMRGCSRGCRFCQAGYIYRPSRERSPKVLLENIDIALKTSGFEEISLLSLSSVDYCQIEPLLAEIMNSFAEENSTAISFPSTRVDGLTPFLLEQLQRVRQTAFTIAPEAGSERLRKVINKQITSEQILTCCSIVLGHGWKGIKLYFMIGLPTETDEDLDAIVDLALQIKRLPQAKGKSITVSASTFVPKPHTPFQWAQQISPEETKRRQELIHRGLKRYKITFRYHQPFSSMLEGLFSRGSQELGELALKAYKHGAVLDAWHEHLNKPAWEAAFADMQINPLYYLRSREITETLPWEMIATGIPKEYFFREYKKALHEKSTESCFGSQCSGCDICKDGLEIKRYINTDPITHKESLGAFTSNIPVSRIRCRYRKGDELRFIGHLELVDIFTRAVKRSHIPICFSQGFHPMARIAFGPPLQLGLESTAEFLDLFLYDDLDTDDLIKTIQPALPSSLLIISATKIDLSYSSIQQAITSQTYELFCPVSKVSPDSFLLTLIRSPNSLELIQANKLLRSFNNPADNRSRTRSEHSFDLKEHVLYFKCSIEKGYYCIVFELHCNHSKQNLRATDFASYVTGLTLGEYSMKKIAVCFSD